MHVSTCLCPCICFLGYISSLSATPISFVWETMHVHINCYAFQGTYGSCWPSVLALCFGACRQSPGALPVSLRISITACALHLQQLPHQLACSGPLFVYVATRRCRCRCRSSFVTNMCAQVAGGHQKGAFCEGWRHCWSFNTALCSDRGWALTPSSSARSLNPNIHHDSRVHVGAAPSPAQEGCAPAFQCWLSAY